MKEEITKYLCERNEKFLQYHTGNANSMVNEVQEFLKVADLLHLKAVIF